MFGKTIWLSGFRVTGSRYENPNNLTLSSLNVK